MSDTTIAPQSKHQALAWLVKNSPTTVASYTELGNIFGWERAKTWKVIQQWKRKGYLVTDTAPDTGRLTVTVIPNAVPIDASDGAPDDHGDVGNDSVREGASPLPAAAERPYQPAVPPAPDGSGACEAAVDTFYAAYVQPPRETAVPTSFIDAALYVVAVALAAVAAYFSVSGMITLFPGAAMAIMIAGIVMETAKLTVAAWLGQRWNTLFWLWRIIVPVLLLNVVVINAAGVYAQLVSAHIGHHGEVTAGIETRNAEAAAKIEVAADRVADLDKQIAAIDGAVAEATKRGRTDGAMAVMESQKKTRAALAAEREKAAGTLAALKTERIRVAATGRAAETEATPIVYTAQLLGITADPETVIRMLIAMIVMAFDPLALALTFAASSRHVRKAA
jgi:cytochrome c oxidase subunit IV